MKYPICFQMLQELKLLYSFPNVDICDLISLLKNLDIIAQLQYTEIELLPQLVELAKASYGVRIERTEHGWLYILKEVPRVALKLEDRNIFICDDDEMELDLPFVEKLKSELEEV